MAEFKLKPCEPAQAEQPWDTDADVALTPRGVVKQGLDVLIRQTHPNLRRMRQPVIVDAGAGSGVYGAELRELLPRAYTIGVEAADHPWPWQRHYSQAVQTDFAKFEPGIAVDVIVGNPPFSQLEAFVSHALELLRPGGRLFFFGLNEWGQRAPSHAKLWELHRPCYQWRVQGGIKFRTGTNPKNGKPWSTDARSYSHWCWEKGARPLWTGMVTLPHLPFEHRSWEHPPGQEPWS